MTIVYHGTTHVFDKFKIKNQSVDNHVGFGVYLTACPHDVKQHYAGVGSDLTQKLRGLIDRLSEKYPNKTRAEIKEMARKTIVGPGRYVLQCRIKDGSKLLRLGKHAWMEMYSFDPEDDDAECELSEFAEIVNLVCDKHGYSFEITDCEMSTASILKQLLKQWDGCNLSPSLVFAEIAKRAGYDGIEYDDAYEFFPQMVKPNTKHFVLYNPSLVEIVKRQTIEEFQTDDE